LGVKKKTRTGTQESGADVARKMGGATAQQKTREKEPRQRGKDFTKTDAIKLRGGQKGGFIWGNKKKKERGEHERKKRGTISYFSRGCVKAIVRVNRKTGARVKKGQGGKVYRKRKGLL